MAALDTVLAKIDGNLDLALGRLFKLIEIPSVSTDPAFAGDCAKAAEWLAAELRGIGFEASVRKTPGHPIIVGQAKAARPDVPHLLIYGHYDVQPPDPLDLWESPPFEPRIVEAATGKRIAGRGVADDKGQLMTFVEACRAFTETGGLPCHITFLIEGEEETGSPSLPVFLGQAKAELKADMALVCDTGMWDRETPAITIMLRGLVLEEVVIQAANRDLHSGIFGGAAVNPIHMLAKIIADLHDEKGRVALPGFYNGVAELPEDVAGHWRELHFRESDFLGEVGLAVPAGEQGRGVLEMLWSRPTCDLNGIVGGYTGKGSKTVLPAQASAKFSFRLVGSQDPVEIAESFPGVRQGTTSRRLPRRICLAWRVGRGAAAVQFGGVVAGAQGITGRMGQGAGSCRVRRFDSDRRRLQARSWDGHVADRFRLGGRSHSLAEREIRAFLVSQGNPELGAGFKCVGAVTDPSPRR